MSCECATADGNGRFSCAISGDGCVFFVPNAKACAEQFGEGSESNEAEK